MRNYLRGTFTVYKKDLLLELRSKETLSTLAIFSILVALIFSFAFDPSPRILAIVGPGIVWVAYTFAGILGLGRIFSQEVDKATLEGLIVSPLSKDALYMGKLLGSLTLMAVIEIIMMPVFIIFFDLNLLNFWFFLLTFLATVGFAAVGTIFSALAINTRSRDMMLPILFLPMVVPVIISAVAGTQDILNGKGWDDIGEWIKLLIAFDLIFIVLSSILFEFLLEE